MNKLFLICIILALYSCAVIQAPSGGPKDKTPPEIAEFSPSNYTRNFDGEQIVLEFDEYINRGDVIKSTRINPPIELGFKWRARKLIIEFEEKLAENTTYSMQLGTGFSDLSGNKPNSAFELVFSTGESLDSLRISGKLEAEKPEGLLVYLWQLDDSISDTSEFISDPDYITELGGGGGFSFGALKDAEYRVLVFDDKNQNKIYDNGLERFAVTQNDVRASDNPETNNMKLSEALDIEGPRLSNALASSYESVDLNFSEKIISNEFEVSLSDSLSGVKYEIRSFYFLDSIPGKKVRLITGKLETEKAIRLEAFALDTTEKQIIDSANTAYIYAPDRELTKESVIEFTDLKDSSRLESTSLEYVIEFPTSPRIVEDNIARLFSMNDSSEIELNKINLDSRTYVFSSNNLSPEAWYQLKIDLSNINGIFNDRFKDTTFEIHFETGVGLIYSKITGTIADSTLLNDGQIIKIYNKDRVYYSEVDEAGWTIDKILPGFYSAEIFWDTNGNGLLDKGSVSPYKFSERYLKFSNNIEIKERWDLEDIILSY